jgi:hypothetical protein
MWSVAIYYFTLLITVAVAIRRGGPLERWAAYTALIASVLTSALTPFPTWTDIEVQHLRDRRAGPAELLVHRHEDPQFLALLDYRMAADCHFRPYSEVHVLGDTGATLFAPLGLYIVPDPAFDHLCIGFVQSAE